MLKVFKTSPASLWSLALDAAICAMAFYLSLILRLGSWDISEHALALANFLPLFVAIRIGTLFFQGSYRFIWRYSSLHDLTLLSRGVFLSTLLFFACSYLLPDFGRLPRSVFFIDFFIALAGLAGVRALKRLHHERRGRIAKGGSQKVIIYGAGENGRLLAHRLQNDPHIQQNMIGFVDDDPRKVGRLIAGIPVLGTGEDLPDLIKAHNARGVIVSISQADGGLIRKVVDLTRPFNILPQVFNHFTGRRVGQENILREVSLSDLLTRRLSDIDFSAVRQLVQGRTVLVTGAGGSIGSEVARQVLKYQPKKLLLADHSEFNLYNIDHELRQSTQDQNSVLPILIDIKDKASLANLFATHKPEVVYHGAAYKHVHLVELNTSSAILNNILGTLNLLELSEQHRVSTFLNISTDKAVNPVGVMGATKRVCELLTSAFGHASGQNFCSVRFGNVLGSSGSLIPLLQSQIQNGGPLTITHPEMQRYFMLIPEAVSLVLMSSILSKPGDISLLKMGEQVKILELAKSLIVLSGKTEDEIKITFTGLRPGEKMYEELYICGDELQTSHPDILTIPRGDQAHLSLPALKSDVLAMIEFAGMQDPRALEILRRLASQDPRQIKAKVE